MSINKAWQRVMVMTPIMYLLSTAEQRQLSWSSVFFIKLIYMKNKSTCIAVSASFQLNFINHHSTTQGLIVRHPVNTAHKTTNTLQVMRDLRFSQQC
jgi:hypothetical protein